MQFKRCYDSGENEITIVEDEDEASNTQTDTTGTDLISSDASPPQSGGGSFWLPLLIFALVFRLPIPAIQKQY